MDSIIAMLGELRVYCTQQQEWNHNDSNPIWQSYAEACSEAVSILYALQEGGAHTAEEAKDIVCDYNKLAKQYQAMYQRFGAAGHAVHKDGIWHCPSCNRKVTPGHSFCHWCGKKMAWCVSRKGGRKRG